MTTAPAVDMVCLDLDESGDLLDSSGQPIAPANLSYALPTMVNVPSTATDIVVFVHGWRNDRTRAAQSAQRLFTGARALYLTQPNAYPALAELSLFGVVVRWPSMSSPLLSGYRRIRDRAHAMTTSGRAAWVLAHLLGYLNQQRRTPVGGPPRLRTAGGQYLHCVAHSFGGRFIGEAIKAAAAPQGPPRLQWPWHDPRYPYTVDTLLIFQMAAPPTIFDGDFAPLLGDAPINAPVALTYSRHDRATGRWHRLAEGAAGIGAVGASAPAAEVTTIRLRRTDEPYALDDAPTRILNLDSAWRYRSGFWRVEGAHSDIWHPESMHLLLSLAALAR